MFGVRQSPAVALAPRLLAGCPWAQHHGCAGILAGLGRFTARDVGRPPRDHFVVAADAEERLLAVLLDGPQAARRPVKKERSQDDAPHLVPAAKPDGLRGGPQSWRCPVRGPRFAPVPSRWPRRPHALITTPD